MNVTTLEVSLETAEEYSEAINLIAQRKETYRVVKIPTNLTEPLLKIQSEGFTFIEVLTVCEHDDQLPPLSPLQKRIFDELRCELITESNRELLSQGINQFMFQTDRVAIDPHFSEEQAASRYMGWLVDEEKNGGAVMQLMLKEKFLGFFVFRQIDEQNYVCNLAGLMPGSQTFGVGFFLNYFQILELINRGGKILISTFSSNNRGASAIHLSIGYTLRQQYYVFVQHMKVSNDSE